MENQTELKIEYVKVADLVPYDKNPRNNSPAVNSCAESIKAFGFSVPIITDADLSIVCGHTRRLAAMKLGMETVPVVRRTDLTPEQIRAFRIVDNKISEQSEWNEELLKEEVLDLPEFNFGSFGFDMDDFTSDMADADTTEDEFDLDATPEEINVKAGEVWKLGDHLLMCGDSTKEGDINTLMAVGTPMEAKADLWLTDPPYNVAYEGSNGLTIQNDSMEDVKFREFLRSAFACAEKVMKPGAPFYIFHSDSEGHNFHGACHDVGLRVRQCLVWKKNSLVLGRQDYQWIHEPCLYGWKDGAGHEWYADRSQTTLWEEPAKPVDEMTEKEMRAMLKRILAIKNVTVMEFDRPNRSAQHPTMKPIALFSYLLSNSSKRGDVVLDDFGGSGTTLICCERMGRKCRMMEFDPMYAQRIINRWEEETGGKAECVYFPESGWTEMTPLTEEAEK